MVSDPANSLASPYGWHDTNGAAGAEFTTTQGNNAHAYTDTDNNNSPDTGSSPSGGSSLNFDFPLDLGQAPSTYRPAAVSNLFYWNNVCHDYLYRLGFDEAAGNFQATNSTGEGRGNDAVNADAQDGGGDPHLIFPAVGEASERSASTSWSARWRCADNSAWATTSPRGRGRGRPRDLRGDRPQGAGRRGARRVRRSTTRQAAR